MTQFGKKFRKEHFPQLPDSALPINHGSFGLPPKEVIAEYHAALDQDLKFPDEFYGIDLQKAYRKAVNCVASVVNTKPENVALVANATTGVNAIFHSLDLNKGDVVALPNTTYGACANTVQFLQDYKGIDFVKVELEFPMLDLEVVAKFREVFEKNKVKVALFDTVASMPGVRLPWEQLVLLCREFGVVSVVDGAHSIGLIPLDLDQAKPDFLCSNLHKWFSTPRNCAFIYVNPKYHRQIQTLPVSHGYVPPEKNISKELENDILFHKFWFHGSASYGPLCVVPAAIKFRNEVCGGEKKIQEYGEQLMRDAQAVVLEKWPKALILENAEGTLCTSMMSFFVPIEEYSEKFDPLDSESVNKLVDDCLLWMLTNRGCRVPLAGHAGKIVARFSAHLYNDLNDYVLACEALDGSLKAFFAESQ